MTLASASLALPSAGTDLAQKPTPRMDRRLTIVMAVIGFHVLALWALQTGLLRRAAELVVPVQLLAEMIELPQPQVALAPEPPPQPLPEPVPRMVQAPRKPAPRPDPQPQAVTKPEPSAPAPQGNIALPPATLTESSPVALTQPAPAPAQPAPPAPPEIELPSSDADYLKNPRPPYPQLSKRLGEQGKVVVRVLIETNGTASKAEIRTSSGFDRLDVTALQTVLTWRYVPGKRAGVPEAMWFNIPIHFELTAAR
jgi:periplasmic protein TonB